MSGTREGGLKAMETNKARYGNNFYQTIGSKGGQKGKTGGFASQKIGKDGLTGLQRASIAGAKGGRQSTRWGISNGEGRSNQPKQYIWNQQ